MPARAKKQAAAAPADPKDALLESAAQQFGAGALMEMGAVPAVPVSVIPTGCIALDSVLGIGGLPRGRIVEIYGPEMSGKTTLALHAIASAQKAGGLAVMIDAEHAMDPDYAAVLGVDVERLLISQPDTGEQALEIADMCIRSRIVDIVVVDSVAALVPRAEIEGEMGDSHPGLQARLMSQALRKITGALGDTRTTCIFINQLREKIGVFYGNPEVTTGGKALKFYASVRLDIRKIELLKEGQSVYGQRVRIKVVKNKLAPPFRQVETDIVYGRGFVREAQLLDLGVDYGVITKAGAFFSYDGVLLGQGKEKARAALGASPAMDAIEAEIRARMSVSPAATTAAPAPVVVPEVVERPAAAVDPGSLVGSGSLADLAMPQQTTGG